MRRLSVPEHGEIWGVALSAAERDALLLTTPSITLRPSVGLEGHYDLQAGNEVGAIEVGNLALEIRPKIPLDRVLFLVSYAVDPRHWRDLLFGFGTENSLVEAVALGFAYQLRRAIAGGVLRGYRSTEDSLQTVRGRIRLDDQLRRHFARLPPVEVRFDEFTEDITENRLLKAALRRLGRLQIRSTITRALLRHFEAALAGVAEPVIDSRSVPSVDYNRLNAHYRPAVELARVILRGAGWELRHGPVRASSMLVDMAWVFEEFVGVALRESLAGFPGKLRHGDRTLRLDQAGAVVLKPDLTWWHGRECVFIGDVKYKRVNTTGINHADLYQLLAYTIAAQLPRGLLIYAEGEAQSALHRVPLAGKELEVIPVHLAGTPESILVEIDRVAELVIAHATSGTSSLAQGLKTARCAPVSINRPPRDD